MANKFFRSRKKLGLSIGSIVLAALLALNLMPVMPLVTVEAFGYNVKVPSVFVKGEGQVSIQSDVAVQADTSEPEYVEPTISRGGVPIRGIYFDNGIRVEFLDQEPYEITKDEMLRYLRTHSMSELENYIEGQLEELIGDNYVAVHFYSQEPLKYTTQFSINKIEGEWWD